MKPEGEAKTQIRFKYEYKYTQKDKKYTKTKIQTHTNTNFTVGSLARSEEEKKMRFSEKSVLMKLAVTSVPEYFQKLPACQNVALLQG